MFFSCAYFLYFISIFMEMSHEESDALRANSETGGIKLMKLIYHCVPFLASLNLMFSLQLSSECPKDPDHLFHLFYFMAI